MTPWAWVLVGLGVWIAVSFVVGRVLAAVLGQISLLIDELHEQLLGSRLGGTA